MAKDIKYVIVALYIFDNAFPIFTDLVGITSNSADAFDKLEAYDCKKVIAADYNMTINRVQSDGKDASKWFGDRNDRFEYDEERYYEYRCEGCDETGFVKVVYTIYSA